MSTILSLFLSGPTGLVSLFFLTFAASYIIVPTMGGILVSFGASASGIPKLLLLMLITYVAASLGDITIYLITRRFSNKVLKLLKKFKLYHKNNKRARLLLKKYGFWIILVSRFTLTEICLIMNYVAGFTKFNKKKFVTAVLLGELIYAIAFTLFGYIFKDTWNYLLGLLQDSFLVVIVIILAFFIIKKIIKLIKKEERLMTQKNL